MRGPSRSLVSRSSVFGFLCELMKLVYGKWSIDDLKKHRQGQEGKLW
jgi:hypothetical protein